MIMQHPVVTLGDTDTTIARGITALDNARKAVEGHDVDSPRAVLAFADLRHHSRQSGKERLRALVSLATAEAKRYIGIRHVVFAVSLAPEHESAFDRIASALGARVHAELERDNARDIEVTFLNTSGCSDISTLTERLLDRCDDPVGQHGVVVLDWSDIRQSSIRHAARDQYL